MFSTTTEAEEEEVVVVEEMGYVFLKHVLKPNSFPKAIRI